MQYNQPFYGNGVTNGQFYSSNNSPLQCTQNMYPELVGEGQVTSVTLPDGTIQFFFMPTVKWWPSNAPQCQPMYPNVANPMVANNIPTNYNIPPCNTNIGTWFVRSISNPSPLPAPPQNTFNPTCQRNDLARPFFNSDHNMQITQNPGYQVKFHNDDWTSTTDLVYFYPSLRQRDYMYKPPCMGSAAVQTETGTATANNTMCQYEYSCSKPCHCRDNAKHMSIECLPEPKLNTKSKSTSVDRFIDIRKKPNKRCDEDKVRLNKSNNICGSYPTANDRADKSVEAKEDCTCTSGSAQKTKALVTKHSKSGQKKVLQNTFKENSNESQRCDIILVDTWFPRTSLSKRVMKGNSSESIDCSDNEL